MVDHPRRRWLVPGLCLAGIVLGVSAWPLWYWLDLDQGPTMVLNAGGHALALLCGAGLAIWLLFFSGLSSGLRRGVGLALLGTAGFLAAAIDGFDVTGDMRFRPRFRWQRRPLDDLDAHRAGVDTSGLPPIDARPGPDDSPRFRGERFDGAGPPGVVFDMDWESNPPRLLWKQPCGGGFSGFAVAGNVAITMEQRGENEVVVCYDRASGKERWATEWKARFTDYTGDGPRSTPAIAGDVVLALGATGRLVCLKAATGKEVWHADTLADSKADNVAWGITSSPLVVGGLVVVNAGVGKANNTGEALAAYDIKSGKRAWAVGEHQAGYSSPIKAKLVGVEQILLFDAGGLAGYGIEKPGELWRYPWKTFSDMNIVLPQVIDGDKVLISSEAGNGAALLKVERSKDGSFAVDAVWKSRGLAAKYASPVMLGRTIYGLSIGTMVALDADTGERLWRGKHYGHGQLIAVNGSVLVLSEEGFVALVSGDRTGNGRELGRIEGVKGRTWNTPALAGRHLFVRNDKEMACFELPVREK